MNLPKISGLDLRAHEIIVAEHNAKGGLQIAIWKRKTFERFMR